MAKFTLVERNKYLYTFEREDGKILKVNIEPENYFTIGVSGRRLKNMMSPCQAECHSILYCLLSNNYNQSDRFIEVVNRMLSLGYTELYYREWRAIEGDLQQVLDNWKKIVKYLKTIPKDTRLSLDRLQELVLYTDVKALFPESHQPTTREIENFLSAMRWCNISFSLLENKKFARLLVKNFFSDLTYITDDRHIMAVTYDYYKKCKALEWKLETGDFVRNYAKAIKSYEARKKEIEDKQIRDWQSRAEFAFEDDDFVVIVPTTKDEFITEGEALNNCLGGWELNNRVLPHTATVVFIRQKSNIDKPYIACDFDNDGRIEQFYLKNNSDVRDEKANRFRQAYQEYLTKLFAEM